MNVFMGHFEVVLEELICKGVRIDTVIVENKPINFKVINIARKHNIAFYIVDKYEEIEKIFSKYEKIDYCFVASFGIILKSKIIKKCNYIINFHPGDVFICRGRHPLPSAILYNYPEMGITVHLIDDERIDAGPILYRLLMPIDYNSSYKFNEMRLLKALKCLASLVADDIKEKRIVVYKWDPSRSIYFKPLKKEVLQKIINSSRLMEIRGENNNN